MQDKYDGLVGTTSTSSHLSLRVWLSHMRPCITQKSQKQNDKWGVVEVVPTRQCDPACQTHQFTLLISASIGRINKRNQTHVSTCRQTRNRLWRSQQTLHR